MKFKILIASLLFASQMQAYDLKIEKAIKEVNVKELSKLLHEKNIKAWDKAEKGHYKVLAKQALDNHLVFEKKGLALKEDHLRIAKASICTIFGMFSLFAFVGLTSENDRDEFRNTMLGISIPSTFFLFKSALKNFIKGVNKEATEMRLKNIIVINAFIHSLPEISN